MVGFGKTFNRPLCYSTDLPQTTLYVPSSAALPIQTTVDGA